MDGRTAFAHRPIGRSSHAADDDALTRKQHRLRLLLQPISNFVTDRQTDASAFHI
ncbi:hypothetical protein V3C99_005191 [Haemonchus contortus]